MQEVASILKNVTSIKQYNTEREDNHLLITYEIATSESNKGTMDLNDELLSNNRLNLDNININVVETNPNLNSKNQLKPEDGAYIAKPGNQRMTAWCGAIPTTIPILVQRVASEVKAIIR